MPLPVLVTSDVADRRHRRRLNLAYPVRLCRPGEDFPVETRTENLTCEGFFCVTETAFSLHEALNCELLIYDKAMGWAGEQDIVLRCRVEVVRVMPQRDGVAFGVACRLADYTLADPVVEPEVAAVLAI